MAFHYIAALYVVPGTRRPHDTVSTVPTTARTLCHRLRYEGHDGGRMVEPLGDLPTCGRVDSGVGPADHHVMMCPWCAEPTPLCRRPDGQGGES
mgnify:CR=1 FL=1